MSDPAPPRRTVLAAAGAVALSACTGRGRDAEPPPRPDPDVAIRAAVVAAVRSLAASYRSTADRHPELRARLAPLAAEHAAHLAALSGSADRATDPPSPRAGTASPRPETPASSAPESTAGPGAETTAVPDTVPAAVAALVAAESRNAQARVADAAGASPALARLVASVGGGEAAHAALLGGGA
jgi:hypothetical protein